jgi:hypothetical protein
MATTWIELNLELHVIGITEIRHEYMGCLPEGRFRRRSRWRASAATRMNVSCDLPCKLEDRPAPSVTRSNTSAPGSWLECCLRWPKQIRYGNVHTGTTRAAINNFDAASLPQRLIRRRYMLDGARRDSISITTIEWRGALAMRRRTHGTVLRRDRDVVGS